MKQLIKGKKQVNSFMAHLDYEPRGGWTKEVTPELVEKAKSMCVRKWGTKGMSQQPFSGALFGYNNPAYMPNYEVDSKLIWRYTLKLAPIPEGESYKKALMEVLGVRSV